MFNSDDPADLAALKLEVETDPNGYGYDVDNTSTIITLINEKRPEITVSKPQISGKAIKNATYFEAYNTLSIDEQEYIKWITEGATDEDTILVTQNLRDMLTGTLGGGTEDSIWAAAHDDIMEPIMLALIDIQGSRAEELFGYSSTISSGDWFAARDS